MKTLLLILLVLLVLGMITEAHAQDFFIVRLPETKSPGHIAEQCTADWSNWKKFTYKHPNLETLFSLERANSLPINTRIFIPAELFSQKCPYRAEEIKNTPKPPQPPKSEGPSVRLGQDEQRDSNTTDRELEYWRDLWQQRVDQMRAQTTLSTKLFNAARFFLVDLYGWVPFVIIMLVANLVLFQYLDSKTFMKRLRSSPKISESEKRRFEEMKLLSIVGNTIISRTNYDREFACATTVHLFPDIDMLRVDFLCRVDLCDDEADKEEKFAAVKEAVTNAFMTLSTPNLFTMEVTVEQGPDDVMPKVATRIHYHSLPSHARVPSALLNFRHQPLTEPQLV